MDKCERMKSMNIKILAIDMDDTLLTKELFISNRNKKALQQAEQRGVIIILASGRGPYAMDPFIRELGMDQKKGYVIGFNGACIFRTDTKQEIYGFKLHHDLAVKAYEIVSSYGFPIQTYKDDTIYVSYQNKYTDIDCTLTGMNLEVVEDFASLLYEGAVKFVIPGEPEKLLALKIQLDKDLGAVTNIFISKPYFLEIMPKQADKGIALAYMTEKLQIPREQVMAIGDAMNDAGMIQYAGVGVAMANAVQEIKDMANIISSNTHDHDGVAEIVERYILS